MSEHMKTFRQISKEILEDIDRTMPPFWFRRDADKYLFGVLSVNTLANLDSRKLGPPRYLVGKRTTYRKDSFMAWLKQYFNFQEDDNADVGGAIPGIQKDSQRASEGGGSTEGS